MRYIFGSTKMTGGAAGGEKLREWFGSNMVRREVGETAFGRSQQEK
jgi:hypothetical protein